MRIPDHQVAEILEGALYVSPRPAVPHAVAGAALTSELWSAFQQARGGPGGWWILYEPELHLGADVVVPDVAGWRCSHLPELPNAPAIAVAPDWVCEILSPSTEALDRVAKLRVYAREGVSHVWLANPKAQTLEVLQLERGSWMLVVAHDGDASVRVDPFAAVPLDLFRLWGRAAPGS